MVDRDARNFLAALIAEIAVGNVPWKNIYHRKKSSDLAISEISGGSLIRIFSDGIFGFAPYCVEEVAPTVAFLKTNLEYEWPLRPRRPWYDELGLFQSHSFGSQMRVWSEAGKIKYYPFFRQSDFDKYVGATNKSK
jgi:hypothetical protein